MIKMTEVENRMEAEGTVPAGQTSDWVRLVEWPDREALIAVYPGDSMRMEYTLDSEDAVEADSANAIAWDDGDVSVDTTTAIPTNVTAVRFVATGADGNYRVVI